MSNDKLSVEVVARIVDVPKVWEILKEDVSKQIRWDCRNYNGRSLHDILINELTEKFELYFNEEDNSWSICEPHFNGSQTLIATVKV
jgi:hypothetical protein